MLKNKFSSYCQLLKMIYGHLYNEMQEEAAEVMYKLVTPIQREFPQTAKFVDR